MIDIEISTYWNVDTLYNVFNGVAAIMGGRDFEGLIKTILLVGMTVGMFAYMGSKQIELFQWLIQSIVFVTLLNLPIARVAISDKTGLEPPKVVDNVPFSVAIIAQTTTHISSWMTEKYESVFGLPDDLGLQKGDVAFGHRILRGVNKITIRDTALRADLMQFFKECTRFDVRDGVIQESKLVGESGSWDLIFDNTNPARFVTVGSTTGTPETLTCTDAAASLKQKVNGGISAAMAYYGRQAFPRADSDAMATSMYASAIGASYDWIAKNSADASDSVKQAMFNNIWKDAGADIQELQTSSGAALAAKQSDGSNSVVALLAQETIPHMRNWIEAIIYSVFPIVVILSISSSIEGAKKVISGYIMSIAWIGMWPVMFAVINHLSLTHLQKKLAALKLASNGVTFQLTDVFDATLSDEQTAIGYLIILVPAISAAIVKMGQGGLTALSEKATSGFAGAASNAGAGAATGTVSLGNVSMDNLSANNTSMNKFDSTTSFAGGGVRMEHANGDVSTISSSGAVALQQLSNKFAGVDFSNESRMSSDRSSEVHNSEIFGRGQQEVDRRSLAATTSDSAGHGTSKAVTGSDGNTASTQTQGGFGNVHASANAVSAGNSAVDSFAIKAGATSAGSLNLGLQRQSPQIPGQGLPVQAPATGQTGNPTQPAGGGGAASGGVPSASASPSTSSGATPSSTSPGGKSPAVSAPSPTPNGAPTSSSGVAPPRLTAGLSYNASKVYGADQSRVKSSSQDSRHSVSGTATTSFSTTGQQQHTAGKQTSTTVNDHTGKDASLAGSVGRDSVNDTVRREELGVGQKAATSSADSFSIRQDMTATPEFLMAVARRNNLSATRFASLAHGKQLQMMRGYAAESQALQRATTRQSGEGLPTSTSTLDANFAAAQNSLLTGAEVRAQHSADVGKTGFKKFSQLKPDTSLPAVAASAKAGASQKPGSAKFDENVEAWSGKGKEVGAGIANPLAVVEDIMWTDAKDTAKKVADKVFGSGNGTADGTPITDTMKLDPAPRIMK